MHHGSRDCLRQGQRKKSRMGGSAQSSVWGRGSLRMLCYACLKTYITYWRSYGVTFIDIFRKSEVICYELENMCLLICKIISYIGMCVVCLLVQKSGRQKSSIIVSPQHSHDSTEIYVKYISYCATVVLYNKTFLLHSPIQVATHCQPDPSILLFISLFNEILHSLLNTGLHFLLLNS